MRTFGYSCNYGNRSNTNGIFLRYTRNTGRVIFPWQLICCANGNAVKGNGPVRSSGNSRVVASGSIVIRFEG
ncbi:MAG TPA: hypothetical protein VFF23_12575 [Hanamia sp.]|nr:hypothetical protein [Hanamia sp.]